MLRGLHKLPFSLVQLPDDHCYDIERNEWDLVNPFGRYGWIKRIKNDKYIIVPLLFPEFNVEFDKSYNISYVNPLKSPIALALALFCLIKFIISIPNRIKRYIKNKRR